MPGVTPPCYNRPPMAEGMWCPTGRVRLNVAPWPAPPVKEVYRWVPRWFEDKCVTHDGKGIGPKGESYPDAHGWDCAGCRWHPHPVPAWLQAKYAQIQAEMDKHARKVEEFRARAEAWADGLQWTPEQKAVLQSLTPVPIDDVLGFYVDNPVDNPEVIPRPAGSADAFALLAATGRAILARQQEREKNQEWSRRTEVLVSKGRRAGWTTAFHHVTARRLSDSLCADLGITAPYRNRA